MAQLTITGKAVVKDDHVDFIRAASEQLIPITRTNAGCIQDDLQQGKNTPTAFMFYEAWDSRALWQSQMKVDHLAAYMTATDGRVEKLRIHQLPKIAQGHAPL